MDKQPDDDHRYFCEGCTSITTQGLAGPVREGCSHCGCGSESTREATPEEIAQWDQDLKEGGYAR